MRRRLLVAIGVVTTILLGGPAAVAQERRDPLLGTWILDRAKSTFSGLVPFYGGTPPASRIMRFELVTNGIQHVTETRTIELGEAYRTTYTFRIDGKTYPTDPQMAINDVSFRRVDRQTVERIGRYQGHVVEIVLYQVSDDGKTLTCAQRATNRDAAGNEIEASSVQIFAKQ